MDGQHRLYAFANVDESNLLNNYDLLFTIRSLRLFAQLVITILGASALLELISLVLAGIVLVTVIG